VLGNMRLGGLKFRVDIPDVLCAELHRCRELCGGKKGLIDGQPLGRPGGPASKDRGPQPRSGAFAG
jgi:hypothetical protein